MELEHTCPSCNGAKGHGGISCPGFKTFWMECDLCQGTGAITAKKLKRYEAGKEKQKDRRARGLTLREEAKRLGISPTELSKIERGLVDEQARG